MDKPFYQEQTENMLLKTRYFYKLDDNPHKEIMKKYRSLLKNHEAELTKKNIFITLNARLEFVMDSQKSI